MSSARGITDTTGVMLVAAVAITVSLTVGVGVLQHQQSNAPSAVNAEMGATLDGGNVTVLHRGGDSMAAADVLVVTRGAVVTKFAGRNATEVVGDGDALFEPGEEWRWRRGTPFAGNTTVLLVERTESGTANNVVDTARLLEPTTPIPTTPTPTPAPTTTTSPAPNAPPTAAVTASNAAPKTGETVTFDASGSSDGDGYVASYEWDLDGDGAVDATGETVTHAYSDDGTYDVTVTVTDDDGATDTASTTVTVGNRAPSASFDASCSGVSCSFTADASDPDGSVASVDWAFGDGETATGTAVTHTYDTGGSYDVTVTVTDDDGATTTATRTVTVDGAVEFVAGDAVAPGGTGKKTAVEVTLANRRASDVRVVAVAVSVDKQKVEAVYEDRAGVAPFRTEFFLDAAADGFAEMGRNRAYETGTREALDDRATVASGGRLTLTVAEFGEIRTKCWWWCYRSFKPRNVQGATVTVEVWLADGTHRTYEFRA